MKWILECRGGHCCELMILQIASKRFLDMWEWRRNGAPKFMSGESFAQNICLGTPWLVPKRKRHTMNLKNSSHVRWVESVSYFAFIMVVLKNSMGKKWRKNPNTICIDGSALTKKGLTSLIPAILLASKDSLPHGQYLLFVPVSVPVVIFWEQAHFRRRLQILELKNSICLHSRLEGFHALRSNHPQQPRSRRFSRCLMVIC